MYPERLPRRGELTAADYEFARQLMLKRAGILLEAEKDYFIALRVSTLATEANFASPSELIEAASQANTGETLRRRLVDSLTVSETSFFRDQHPFEALKDVVIPRHVAAATGRPLRVWSAACATGQEPYSVAMLAREHFLTQAAGHIEILATDLSAATLGRAMSGRYNQVEVNRGLPIRHLLSCFMKDGNDWQLRPEVRSLVEFRELNLAGMWPILPAMDVILLRNVLIYLDGPTRRSVLRRAANLLSPEGVLIVGTGESGIVNLPEFAPEVLGRTLVFRSRVARAGGG